MKKGVIIFTILFFLITGVVVLVLIFKPTPPSSQNLPVRSPQITTFYPNSDIEYKINVDSFNPPSELPLIKAGLPNSLAENEVFQIASTAGLDPDKFSKIYNAENQRLYLFNSNNAYLTIYADTGKVSYRNYERISVPKTKLTENEIISKSSDFLINKFSFNANNLNLSSINHHDNDEYLTITGPAQPKSYYEVNFAPVLTDYKVVTINPEQSPVTVIIADDGTIGKAEITLVHQATISPEQYEIKSFSDLESQIDKTIIVQAHTKEHGQYFQTDSIISIDINHIEVAYLANPSTNTNYYQPIFLLEGVAKSSMIQSPIDVTLYLPALKN